MNEAGSIAAAAPSAVSTASIGQLAGRYLAAFRKMFTPKIIFRAIWNTIRRRLLISLVVAPFIYGLAAIYHVYLQAKAGGWNETAGKLIGPDDLAGPGARWFAGAMMLFGAVSFARGMGLRIVKFTAGALKVSPSGFGYALAQIKANIRRPAVYERLLMVGGGAAVLGDVAMRVGWSLRKFVLLGAVASVLAGFRAAHDQRQKPPGAPLEQQPWLLALAASAGFLLSYLYYGFYATAALVIGVVLWYRRTRTKPPGPPPSAPTSGQTAGWLFAIALILSLGSAPPAWADDGGWDEYSPQGGGEKTFGGYLQTPDGRKVVEFGLLGGGFATAGALLGILLGGTLADAFQQALLRGAGTETAEGEGTEPPDDSLPWQVTAPDGRIHRFGTREEAQAFCDRLVNQENIHQAENDYRNAVEQIGFLESVRQGLVKAGRDTTSQDREIARWKAERDRLHSQVDRMGGSTSYTARQRTSWTFGEHDALIQKQQEERELLNDIHKTSKAIRNLADKDQLQYGEGQADKMLEHLNRMSENLAFGKGEQPSREELDRLQNLLRHELDAEKSRVEARNTNWVKEGAQATSREIFTGRNADGETSYKAMVLRGLIGGATGGQSEYVFEVGDKMYIVHDEVMAGKSGLEAFQTAATRVVTDEIKGRAIQKGLAVTAKAGQVGFEATLAGTKMGDTLTNAAKSTGDFLSQDIRTTLRTGGREMGEGTGNILGKTDIEIPAKAGGGGVEIPSRTEVELPGKPGVEVPTRTDVEVPSKADVEVPTKVEAEVPRKPEAEVPAKPEAEVPTKPEAEVPTKPETEVPAKPEAEVPTKPEAEAPTRTEPEASAKTDAEAPTKSEPESTPSKTEGETPKSEPEAGKPASTPEDPKVQQLTSQKERYQEARKDLVENKGLREDDPVVKSLDERIGKIDKEISQRTENPPGEAPKTGGDEDVELLDAKKGVSGHDSATSTEAIARRENFGNRYDVKVKPDGTADVKSRAAESVGDVDAPKAEGDWQIRANEKTGTYTIESRGGGSEADAVRALEEQMGMKLEPAKSHVSPEPDFPTTDSGIDLDDPDI